MPTVDYTRARNERVKQLQKEYRRNAKLANSRLSALEKRDSGIRRFAYSGATHDTQAFFGKNRFSYKISAMKPEDVSLRDLSMYNTAAKNFLEDVSSTYSGFQAVAQKRVDTIRTLYGIELTTDQAQQIFEDEYFKKLSDAYGSMTALRMIGKLQITSDELKDMIEKAIRQHKSYGEEVVKIAIEDVPVTRKMVGGAEKRILMKVAKLLIK